MRIFKGFVLMKELYTKAKVSVSLFQQVKGVHIEHMGGTPVIRIDSLPLKYQLVAKECIDLEKYYTYSALSDELGKSSEFISTREYYKKKDFKGKQDGRSKLFELSDDFLYFIKKGFTPFVIGSKKDESYADEIVNMQGIKIGFY